MSSTRATYFHYVGRHRTQLLIGTLSVAAGSTVTSTVTLTSRGSFNRGFTRINADRKEHKPNGNFGFSDSLNRVNPRLMLVFG